MDGLRVGSFPIRLQFLWDCVMVLSLFSNETFALGLCTGHLHAGAQPACPGFAVPCWPTVSACTSKQPVLGQFCTVWRPHMWQETLVPSAFPKGGCTQQSVPTLHTSLCSPEGFCSFFKPSPVRSIYFADGLEGQGFPGLWPGCCCCLHAQGTRQNCSVPQEHLELKTHFYTSVCHLSSDLCPGSHLLPHGNPSWNTRNRLGLGWATLKLCPALRYLASPPLGMINYFMHVPRITPGIKPNNIS